jgi:hypothetical protein
MPARCRSLLLALATVPLAVAAVGCSPTHAQVSGRVVEGGKAYTHTGEVVQIVMACDAPSVSVTATVQEDGTFKFYGTEGKGLPAGKYRIGFDSDTERVPHVVKRVREVSPQASSMEIELAGGATVSVTIDLTNRTVSR